MGLIKFDERTIYQGPLSKVEFIHNWCDSMATYYPYIVISFIDKDDAITNTRINVYGFNDPNQIKYFDIELDSIQVQTHYTIMCKREQEKEANTIRLHKLVKVFKGRKVPIGTEGEVFWMGDSGFGMSVGIRLLDGTKVFTSMKNVETVTVDKAFEDVFLK
jgi:hypothetical protein